MFTLPVDRPALMGILNVTPDSFSDGGLYLAQEKAIERAIQMWEEGADIIDVGGESTRPGADEVSFEEELDRILPVLRALKKEDIPVSVDTYKPAIARIALAEGADVLNDVTGLRDPEMIEVLLDSHASVCIMHMQGNPRTMQEKPRYKNVLVDVREYLIHAAFLAEDKGIKRERIWIDPGIGFGKTVAHNLTILRNLDHFVHTGYPVLLGVSRKSFIGKVLGEKNAPLPVEDRLEGTLALQAMAQLQGARIIRAHDVLQARRVIDMLAVIS